jgi:hypothetical protein
VSGCVCLYGAQGVKGGGGGGKGGGEGGRGEGAGRGWHAQGGGQSGTGSNTIVTVRRIFQVCVYVEAKVKPVEHSQADRQGAGGMQAK